VTATSGEQARFVSSSTAACTTRIAPKGSFIFAESFLRGTFVRTVNRTAVVLALIASVILVVHFWRAAVLVGLVGLAAFLIVERIRELRT
jgi:hypothetical protein